MSYWDRFLRAQELARKSDEVRRRIDSDKREAYAILDRLHKKRVDSGRYSHEELMAESAREHREFLEAFANSSLVNTPPLERVFKLNPGLCRHALLTPSHRRLAVLWIG